jgi:hypothetical protein
MPIADFAGVLVVCYSLAKYGESLLDGQTSPSESGVAAENRSCRQGV